MAAIWERKRPRGLFFVVVIVVVFVRSYSLGNRRRGKNDGFGLFLFYQLPRILPF